MPKVGLVECLGWEEEMALGFERNGAEVGWEKGTLPRNKVKANN